MIRVIDCQKVKRITLLSTRALTGSPKAQSSFREKSPIGLAATTMATQAAARMIGETSPAANQERPATVSQTMSAVEVGPACESISLRNPSYPRGIPEKRSIVAECRDEGVQSYRDTAG